METKTSLFIEMRKKKGCLFYMKNYDVIQIINVQDVVIFEN